MLPHFCVIHVCNKQQCNLKQRNLSSCLQRSYQSCSPIQSRLALDHADIRGGNAGHTPGLTSGHFRMFGGVRWVLLDCVVPKEQTPTICLTLEIKYTTLSYPFGFNVVKGSYTSAVFFEIDHQDGYVCRCDTFHSRSLSNCPWADE